MSVAYAADAGKNSISPNVHRTTVAASDQTSRANAIAPKPAPDRRAPRASVRRCDQCAVAAFNGISRTTMIRQFRENSRPNVRGDRPRLFTM